ncbi:c-type cytochrome [bacterium]|nr:c-type cytochrome [bacterium]
MTFIRHRTFLFHRPHEGFDVFHLVRGRLSGKGQFIGIDSPVIGEAVLARLPTLPSAQFQAAGVLLLSRASWVDQWLDAAVSKEDLKSLLTPEVQSQIKLGEAPGHMDKLEALFPEMTKEARPFAEEIARLKIVLAEKREANVRNGRTIFLARCAACHELHAEGGKIGPSLTSYQREDLRTLIPSIVQPGREIREGFENYTLKTRDGRTLVGFLKSKTPTKVILQPAGGAAVSVGAGQILTLEPSRTSLMPPGLLSGLSDQELIDFFTYLRSPQPLNLPGVGGFKPKID